MLLILVLGACYFAIKLIGEAFGAECEQVGYWRIEGYEVKKDRCIGWAGPHYNRHYLYEEGKQISNVAHTTNTCTMVFVIEKGLCLQISICDSTISRLTPQKKKLEVDFIDSVHMINTTQNLLKTLSKKEIDKFADKWNTAPVTDYRPYKNPFYPSSSYIIKVFSQGQVRVFETSGFMIKDEESWVYSFLEPGEGRETKKFEQMWNEIGKE